MSGVNMVTIFDMRRLLDYEPDTGVLTWKARGPNDVKAGTVGSAKRWNTRYAGKEAFTAVNNSGYRTGAIFKKPLLAHVVAWCIYNGREPRGEIDHIDGDRQNNRISNLRDVDRNANARNRVTPSNNTSGVIGVSYNKRDRLWAAYIGHQGAHHNLGNFKSREAAIEARKSAEETLGFHPNHGRQK